MNGWTGLCQLRKGVHNERREKYSKDLYSRELVRRRVSENREKKRVAVVGIILCALLLAPLRRSSCILFRGVSIFFCSGVGKLGSSPLMCVARLHHIIHILMNDQGRNQSKCICVLLALISTRLLTICSASFSLASPPSLIPSV